MKKLSEMKIAKEALLSEIESSDKGGRKVGNGTEYFGGAGGGGGNPTTYLDGMNIGADGTSGNIGGDRYNLKVGRAGVVLPSQAGGPPRKLQVESTKI